MSAAIDGATARQCSGAGCGRGECCSGPVLGRNHPLRAPLSTTSSGPRPAPPFCHPCPSSSPFRTRRAAPLRRHHLRVTGDASSLPPPRPSPSSSPAQHLRPGSTYRGSTAAPPASRLARRPSTVVGPTSLPRIIPSANPQPNLLLRATPARLLLKALLKK